MGTAATSRSMPRWRPLPPNRGLRAAPSHRTDVAIRPSSPRSTPPKCRHRRPVHGDIRLPAGPRHVAPPPGADVPGSGSWRFPGYRTASDRSGPLRPPGIPFANVTPIRSRRQTQRCRAACTSSHRRAAHIGASLCQGVVLGAVGWPVPIGWTTAECSSASSGSTGWRPTI